MARARPPSARKWVIEGEGAWSKKVWYGVKRFFAWLETRAYKMHVRVLLSRYRAYTPCDACDGARLKTEALLWRLGDRELADAALGSARRASGRTGVEWSRSDARRAAGPVDPRPRCCCRWSAATSSSTTSTLPQPLDEATDLLLGEIRGRFRYLVDVGLGYLTLDRQSRTLSGGEVQRINLTTALGTSLVNTLFVLDEPSIGLHPRDMQRVIGVMKRLRDAGNSLVVVEHDPQIMLEADRILDLGPGCRRARRRDRVLRHPGGDARAQRLAHRAVPERRRRWSRAGRGSCRRAACAGHRAAQVVAEARSNRWLELTRRLRAQPEEHRRAHPAQAPGVRDRRVRLGQVDAGGGRALPGAA